MNASDQEDLNRLIEHAKTGDQQALAGLFGRYRQQLRRMILFRLDPQLRGRVDPSDILQEAFIDSAARLPEFVKGDRLTFFVWLRLVTKERLLRVHRQHLMAQKRDARREVSQVQLTAGVTSVHLVNQLCDHYTSVLGQAIRAEQQVRLQAILETMDELDRDIIGLRIFEGLSNSQAAEVHGLTKQTASKRFVRAIGRLREGLAGLPGFES